MDDAAQKPQLFRFTDDGIALNVDPTTAATLRKLGLANGWSADEVFRTFVNEDAANGIEIALAEYGDGGWPTYPAMTEYGFAAEILNCLLFDYDAFGPDECSAWRDIATKEAFDTEVSVWMPTLEECAAGGHAHSAEGNAHFLAAAKAALRGDRETAAVEVAAAIEAWGLEKEEQP